MRAFIKDFNGVLSPLRNSIKTTENVREADVLVLWQDVRGDMLELCEINRDFMHKPVIVVQHGRGATRDYLAPNSFPLQADVFCCWGAADKERMERAGYGNKTVVTGSPIRNSLIPLQPHEGKNIVFCPVISSHEEPENIETFFKLKQIELKKASTKLITCKDKLKTAWQSWNVDPNSVTDGSVPFHVLNKDWRLISKLTGIHDKKLYFGDAVTTQQANVQHLNDVIKLLSHTDVVVALEEGTLPLIAMAMDIPVVMVEGFKYKEYGGRDYSSVELIHTDAAAWTEIDKLEEVIDRELSEPSRLASKRRAVVLNEFGEMYGNPIGKIKDVIKRMAK